MIIYLNILIFINVKNLTDFYNRINCLKSVFKNIKKKIYMYFFNMSNLKLKKLWRKMKIGIPYWCIFYHIFILTM
ncbi:MAG: hypothetical protein EA362_02795 [Saprospirales bacterium]|nr:MAG: hypothetical protein EA362_02795 [Saprospirales bacterium]